MNLAQRFNRKIRLALGLPWKHVTEKLFFRFNPELFKLHGSFYLDGYWQNELYFKDIEKTIRSDFQFVRPIDERNKNIAELIKNSNSVSIHIRRGDYINNQLYSGICTEDYYQKAIRFINAKLKNKTFFVFSDDIQWCKSHFNSDNFHFVQGNEGTNSYKDMQLMSYCKHNIIANSSFSWWGAWLNNNLGKIVIAPERWLNVGYSTKDLIPEEWIKIPI
jgi:hypothetical protein